ncbi:MAG: hypothetical protein WB502_03745 [Thermoactinomyces sp.]
MNFFQDLKQKLEKSVESAGQKSQRMLEISRLTLRIKGKKEDIEHQIGKLGWQLYQYWKVNGKLEVTETFRFSLEAIRDQEEQLKILTQELEELKNKEVVPRKTAERVQLDDSPDEGFPDEMHVNGPVGSEVPSVVYICPFCAHQVDQNASGCSHCQKRFY